MAMHQSIDWPTLPLEILPQPRTFTVNAAAFSRCPYQHRDQQDSDNNSADDYE